MRLWICRLLLGFLRALRNLLNLGFCKRAVAGVLDFWTFVVANGS